MVGEEARRLDGRSDRFTAPRSPEPVAAGYRLGAMNDRRRRPGQGGLLAALLAACSSRDAGRRELRADVGADLPAPASMSPFHHAGRTPLAQAEAVARVLAQDPALPASPRWIRTSSAVGLVRGWPAVVGWRVT